MISNIYQNMYQICSNTLKYYLELNSIELNELEILIWNTFSSNPNDHQTYEINSSWSESSSMETCE